MPRRDGLPTNPEYTQILAEIGRNIFVTTLAHTIADGTPPYMRGKLLGEVVLNVHYKLSPPPGIPHPVTDEMLQMRTVGVSEGEFARKHHMNLNATPLADTIAAEAIGLDSIRLGDTDFTPSQIGVWGTHTSYTAYMSGTSRTRHVDTLKERPTKQALVAAIVLGGIVVEYFASDFFGMSEADKKLLRLTESRSGSELLWVSHYWDIPYYTGMVFNGFENSEYLKLHMTTAKEVKASNEQLLGRLVELGASDQILDPHRKMIARANLTIESAEEALSGKDDM